MSADILLVTPSTELGEGVRRTLEETDAYRVHVVQDQASAVVTAVEEACSLALLDLALGEVWVEEIGVSLRTIRPAMKLAVLCGDETPPSLDAIRPWTLVRTPMRIKDLMQSIPQNPDNSSAASFDSSTPDVQRPAPSRRPELLERLSKGAALSQSKGAALSQSKGSTFDVARGPALSPEATPLWMGDVKKAAQHLTRLTLESSAQAALITRQNDLWAYAGGLSQSAAKEVAQVVLRNWDGQRGSDLVRFIRLESTRAEHMLYATRLTADAVLALVFDAETPFSTIRSQANQLAANLGREKPEGAQTDLSAAFDINAGEADDSYAPELPPISEIITDVPTPDPAQSTKPGAPAASQDAARPSGDSAEPRFKWPRREQARDPSLAASSPLGETRMAAPLSNATVFNRSDSSAAPLNEVEVSAPSKARRPQTSVEAETDATRLSPTTEAARKITLEPITAGLYHLTYACLVVPRFSSHYLTGDLANRLADWLPNICVSFGWRLEYLAVRPEYLQWVVNVQPNTSPGFVMRTIREHTNERIYRDFIRIKKENPSGDFWAPGYLIMGGSQPHPPQLVRDYIRQIRVRQGLEARQK